MKICHITSGHPLDDVRIYHKQCLSLKRAGYEVQLLGLIQGRNQEPKIPYILVGNEKVNLFKRFLYYPFKLYKKALELHSDIYHLHDPELMITALLLKMRGKKVVFDFHEDVPKQIYSKAYLRNWHKSVLAKLFKLLENYLVKRVDGIISATPQIQARFQSLAHKAVIVHNFPILEEFEEKKIIRDTKKCYVVYHGVIEKKRGIKSLMDSLDYTDIRLKLAGYIASEKLMRELKKHRNWGQVDFVGYLDRNEIKVLLNEAIAGVVTLLPTKNYQESLPVKMFEYMAAGLPVIASDFPYWKDIILKNECGICVDPENPKEIADAFSFILENPNLAKQMGMNGKKAVIDKYNWEIEANKLIRIYNSIIIDE